ncbi:MAG: hypothetical protein ACNS62_16840 [Candidatus Cyclobacteriaceae bacterium M3_2C_046]
MKENLNAELQLLERKIQLLLSEFERLKAELEEFKNENKELKDIIKIKDSQLKNFQNKIKISKIVDYVAKSEEDIPELKQKINDYIKEIDKCIVHLSK